MEVANVRVRGSSASKVQGIPITSGMIGATVSFDLDERWDNLGVVAVFKAGAVAKDRAVFDPARTEIPHEVLLEAGPELFVGLYGTDTTGETVIPTVWANLGRIVEGADPSGDPGIEPTPAVWEQMLGQIAALNTLSENIDESVRSATEASEASEDSAEKAAASANAAAVLANAAAASAGEAAESANALKQAESEMNEAEDAMRRAAAELEAVDGLYVGSGTPPERASVWIDPNGRPTGTEAWEFDMEDGTTEIKTVVVV